MCANAPKFGFYLQGDNPKSKEFEAWHWQYCLGDKTPDGTAVVVSAPAAAPAAGLTFAYPGTPVKVGSKGDAAKLVQAIVGAKPDGDFGPKTEGMVKAWQTAHGMVADGVVGPATWAKMFG